jgi:ATP-dependent DNA ligase
MAARIDRGDVQLLTRSGLDWTEKYPETAAALAKLPVISA